MSTRFSPPRGPCASVFERRWQAPLLLVAAALLAACFLGFVPAAAADYATPGGSGPISFASIDANTTAVTKTSDSPLTYQVTDNLTVSAGDDLVVTAGTAVEFQNGTLLRVFGGLEITGTAAEPVIMRVVPDAGGTQVDWRGILKSGAGTFLIENAWFNATVNITFADGAGAQVRDVLYEGGLVFVNVSGVDVARISSDPGPVDVGQVPLWFTNCTDVAVAGADLTAGTGWGGAGVHVEVSRRMRFDDVVLRTDNVNLVGFNVLASSDVMVQNYTFTQGPNSGNPGRAVEMRDSDRVWFEGITVTHVGTPVLGTIYGDNSNATIANSTFPVGLMAGSWIGNGKLVGVNATRLPVVAQSGGQVWEFELVRIQVNWTSGGAVRTGSAFVENASWNLTGAVAQGTTPWLWLLREWNDSVNASLSTAYTAAVTCNCTGATVPFTIADEPGAVVSVQVEDVAAPDVAVVVAVAKTGTPGTLSATDSTDNDAVAAFSWTGTVPNVTGLPCSGAVCPVTFFAPGTFTILLTVTDPSGNSALRTVTVSIEDVIAPYPTIVAVAPVRPGQGEPFTVTAAATDNDPGFLPNTLWFLDGVSAGFGGLSFTFSHSTVGLHTVRLEVLDDAGNRGAVNQTVEVRDSTAPVIGPWTAPSGLRPGAQVMLDGTVATDNVGVVSWRWRVVAPGTDYNLTGAHANATSPSAGTYNITLTATDAEGNQANRSFSLTVEAPPATPGFDLVLVAVALAVAAGLGAVVVRSRRRA